jgi:hypothetical protein
VNSTLSLSFWIGVFPIQIFSTIDKPVLIYFTKVWHIEYVTLLFTQIWPSNRALHTKIEGVS